MYYNEKCYLANTNGEPVYLSPNMANRHGFITGATGTGKTTTLKVMAESFAAMGVPVFLTDIKGDLSGICMAGEDTEKIRKRLDKFNITEDMWEYTGFPTRFWDIFGDKGHPIRTTISDMGPTLLSRMLSLSEVQEGVLNLVFHIADENELLLIDLKDLRMMLSFCADHRTEFTTEYGNMSSQSIGAIQRSLLTLEKQGGDIFFGEPAFDIHDWIMCDENGRGYINVLNSDKLIRNPLLYSTFLLWMLSDLYEKLPEEGDMEMPKLVFFFDEAHLLFNDAPKALLDKVTQIVKLIRSKGVGIYFISQSPADIPESVLGQLQNRVQHALHAYTPAEQKAVRTAAQSFRQNPAFKTEDIISTMGVGEALVSFLDEKGIPGIVQYAKILPPQSLMSPAPDEVVEQTIAESEMEELYRESFDRESAYEILMAIREADEEEYQKQQEEQARLQEEVARQKEEAARKKEEEKAAKAAEAARKKEEAERARAERAEEAARKKEEAERKKAEAELKKYYQEEERRKREAEKAEAAERRRWEQEEAARERERRKFEAQLIRDLEKAVLGTATTAAKTAAREAAKKKVSSARKTSSTSSGRKTTSTSTGRRTTGSSRKTTSSRGSGMDGIGRSVGDSIFRGLFGSRI